MHVTPPKPDQATVDHTASPDESVADTPAKVTLDFLGPAQGAEELGRLGHYRILKVLGKGGMGMVFLAEDSKLDRHVALKVMLPKFAEDHAAKQRFMREAKTAAKIEHDHIVHIYQVDEDRGVPFLAMQLLSGSSLEDVLKRAGRLKVPQIIRLGAQIAEGLAVAHGKGLIHRDIKPANIWVEANYGGRVKLLDFGLARTVETDVGITQSGAILGTPAYMPPEQARGEKVDQRCDLYALGCVLYRMATAELPIKGKDTMALLMALALNEPTPPKQLNDAIPAALNDLILKLLAKDADKRPESAKAVAAALKKIEQELAKASQASDVTGELAALATPVAPAPPATVPEPTNPFGNMSGAAAAQDQASPLAAATSADTGGTLLSPGQATQVRPATPRRKYVAAIVAVAGLLAVMAVAVIFFVQWNDTTVTPDEGDYYLAFQGDGSVTVPSLTYDGKTPLTVELWVRTHAADRFSASRMMPISLGAFYAATFVPEHVHQWVAVGPPNRLSQPAVVAPPEQEEWVVWQPHPASTTVDQWTHLAGQWDGAKGTFYVNGRLASTQIVAMPKLGLSPDPEAVRKAVEPWIEAAKGMPMALGTMPIAKFHGDIRCVRVSNTIRYTDTFTPSQEFQSDAETVALYHFKEGHGDQLIDSSGNGHHGKIVGATWAKLGGTPVPRGLTGRPRTTGSFFLAFGGEDFVKVPSLTYDGRTPLTMEAWVRCGPDSVKSKGFQVLTRLGAFGLKTSPDLSYSWVASGSPDPQVNWVRWGPEKGPAKQWIHVAGQWDGMTGSFFVNGKPVKEYFANPIKGKDANSPEVQTLILAWNLRERLWPLGIGSHAKGYPCFADIRGVRVSKIIRYQTPFTPPETFQGDGDTVALYHFDEGQSDLLLDSSGNGHHGKIVGAKWVKIEAVAQEFALDFDGRSSYVEVPIFKPLQGPVTVEAVVLARETARDGAVIQMAATQPIALAQHHNPAVGGTNAWIAHRYANRGGGGGIIAWDKDAVQAHRWVHLAALWDGLKLKLFIDGKAASFEFRNEDINESATGLLLGRWQLDKKAPTFFNGMMKQVRISEGVRYDKDFAPVHSMVTDKATVALYHFDEGQGDRLTDSSGNGHHGKIVGAKWVKVDGHLVAASQNYALHFDALGNGVDSWGIPHDANPTVTLEAYFKRTGPGFGPIVRLNGGDHDIVLARGNNTISFYVHGIGGVVHSVDDMDRWIHVAGVWDGKTPALFVNGEKVGKATPDTTAPKKQELRSVQIGMDVNRLLGGMVDEVHISRVARYDRKFTPRPRWAPDADTIALFHFDEGQGDELKDSSGNGHHGKIVGAKWVKVDTAIAKPLPALGIKARYGLLFDTPGSLVDVADFPYDKETALTIEARLKLVGQYTFSQIVTLRGGAGNFGLWRGPTELGMAASQLSGTMNAEVPLPKNDRWIHLAGVWDGKTPAIFLNGVQSKATRAGPATLMKQGTGGGLGIGSPATVAQTANAVVAEVRISRGVRYAANFQPAARFDLDKDTLALYHFDEGHGDKLIDSSANGHHGKIVGAKWVKVEALAPVANAPHTDEHAITEALLRDKVFVRVNVKD